MLISNFYLVKPLRYQQKKFWSERTDSCQYGCHLPYMGIDTTEHAPHLYCTCLFLKFLVHDTPTFTKDASFQPGLIGQRGQPAKARMRCSLKNWQLVSPVTASLNVNSSIEINCIHLLASPQTLTLCVNGPLDNN